MLVDARWLQRVDTGELHVVVGHLPHFCKHFSDERADMHFHEENLRQMLEHGGVHTADPKQESKPVHKGWVALPKGTVPEQVTQLGDGASLVGLFGAAPCRAAPSSSAPPFIMPDYGLAVEAAGGRPHPGRGPTRRRAPCSAGAARQRRKREWPFAGVSRSAQTARRRRRGPYAGSGRGCGASGSRSRRARSTSGSRASRRSSGAGSRPSATGA